MIPTAAEVLKIAASQIGYKEKKSNKDLDSFTANAGSGNYTKYARDLYIAGYWNGNKNGYDWCTSFVAWCIWKACGENIADAKKLGIKQISGYFALQRNTSNDSQSTLKMLHVGNIALVRMHSDGNSEQLATEPEPTGQRLDDRGMETMEQPLELELDPAEKESQLRPE